jgi:glyoxylase-like metal-dependent hydrolase (beta-lactamase superfamily II)
LRVSPLPAQCAPFVEGVDVFADGSCFAVALPGHARGQLGMFVRHHDQRLYFLVADACWTRAAFERAARPHRVTHLLFDDSRRYYDTIARLEVLSRREPELVIVPSHCEQTFRRLRALGAAQ